MLKKIVWSLLLVFLLLTYVTSAVFIHEEWTSKQNDLIEQVAWYNTKKEVLKNQKMNLTYTKDTLTTQLAVERELEQKEKLAYEVAQAKKEEERKRLLEEERKREEARIAEEKRLEEQARLAELEAKKKEPKRTSASERMSRFDIG